jgi:CheY-like chemotaxis protein
MSFELTNGSSSRRQVLVVDDDRHLRDVLRELLCEEGYSVREARDGREALDVLRHTTASWVVLTDHVMPRMTGPELLAALLADARLRTRHAVIYMTAADQSIAPGLQPLLEAVHALILPKPFSIEVCLDAVASAAERLHDASSTGLVRADDTDRA